MASGPRQNARAESPGEALRPRLDATAPLARELLYHQTVKAAAIVKSIDPNSARPNLVDYESERASFRWETVRKQLTSRGTNIAEVTVDAHARGSLADHCAIRWLGRGGEVRDLTYGDLLELTNRFANVLRELGVGRGDRVFALCGRVPELYVAALGTLKNGSVFCPLFSAFGPDPIRQRLSIGAGRVLVTTDALYRRKLADLRDELPHLEHVLVIGDGAADSPDVLSLDALLSRASPRFEVPPTSPEDAALLHFTSGTTGAPKGAVHVHDAVVAHHATGRYALDLHPDDVYWCTADPGWVTGTSYGIVSPLAHGVTSIVDEAEFDAERWFGILQDQRVNVWYTAPTALRRLMRAGPELARKFDLRALRLIASVGEPLNPEVVLWGRDVLGLPIHDNWWQTETGGIMIANFPALEIRPGSMGLPLPGVDAAILQRREDGGVDVVEQPGVEGELGLRRGWPSMFRAYLDQPERYRKCFRGEWYLTGDLAQRDADGYFWFVGRADDVIKTAGHLIGPFEVENALMEHPAVAEAGMIGIPDPVAGNIVKVFVSLRAGFEPGPDLKRELLAHARRRLGPAVAPRQIEFRDDLPKTRSGKIMRRLLRARELGLPEGDLSTLEEDET
jgi:acetyl-CoA synthetase